MNTAMISVSCQPTATAWSKKATIPGASASHASRSRSSPEVVPSGGQAISGTVASLSPEMLLHVRDHRANLGDDLLQPIGGDAEALRPVAEFIFLVDVDAVAIGLASLGLVVCHGGSPFGG